MRIYFGQIYIQVGATFPFSFAFNHWLGNALSHRVVVTEKFCKKFGAEYKLGFRISAKREIEQPEIRGPSVFRKDKDVEFTIFLPHRSKDYHELAEASLLVEQLLRAAIQVMDQLGLDTTNLVHDLSLIEAEFRSAPNLLNPRPSEIR